MPHQPKLLMQLLGQLQPVPHQLRLPMQLRGQLRLPQLLELHLQRHKLRQPLLLLKL